MRAAPYIAAVFALVTIVLGGREISAYTRHVEAKAARLDAHCARMRVALEGIDPDLKFGGLPASGAAGLFVQLASGEFRIVRPCTGDQPFDNCAGEPGPACIRRSVASILKAWAW